MQGRPNKIESGIIKVAEAQGGVLDVQLDAAKLRQAVGDAHLPSALHRLRTKGLGHPIQNGRWIISAVPSRYPVVQALDPLATTLLARLDMEYFLSWHSALWHHGLIDQQAWRLYVAVPREKRPAKIGRLSIQFVQLKSERFFGYELTDDFDQPVAVSTVERALIDAFDRPRLVGPLPVVIEAMRRAWRLGRLDPERLVESAIRFDSPFVCRRIGFFMDELDLPGSEPLRLHLGRSYAATLGPGLPARGPVDRTWRVYADPHLLATAAELK